MARSSRDRETEAQRSGHPTRRRRQRSNDLGGDLEAVDSRGVRPPRLLRAFLGALIPGVDRDHLLEEIDALYASRRDRHGRLRAGMWHARTVAGFVLRLARELASESVAGFIADHKITVRGLWRRKGFVAAAIVTLAVGLAGVTTVYAIAEWVLLRPVPGVTDPEELVVLRLGTTGGMRPSWPVSHADYREFRDDISSLRSLEASRAVEVNLAAEGLAPMRVEAAIVTPRWFDTLGVQFAAGRQLSADDRPELAGSGEAVIEWGLARALAGGAEAALGETVIVNGSRLAVVGVTAEGFRGVHFPGLQRIWMATGSATLADRSLSAEVFDSPARGVWSHMVGRLRDGADAEAVAVEANGIRERIMAGDRPSTFVVNHFTMQASSRLGLDLGLQGTVGRTLLMLGCAGVFLLLLAVTNVANLGLTHAASRGPEFAVQRALGIGRGRLLRQILAQYLVIGLLAGSTTVTLVTLGGRFLRDIQLDEFGGSLAGFVIEPRVALVAGALAALAGLLAGTGPGLLVLRQRVLDNLRGGGDGPRGARRTRDVLVILQVAVSTTLLVAAGLMARTMIEMSTTDLGFDPSGTVTFTIDPESQGYSRQEAAALLSRVQSAVEVTPDVSAGFVFPQPLSTTFLTSWLSPTSDPEDDRGVLGAHLQVSGAFLDALGARVLAGEEDLERWSGRGPEDGASVVLTRTAAETLMPERELATMPGTVLWKPRPRGEAVPVEVAAVVEDLRTMGPSFDPQPVYFRPWAQAEFDGAAIGWVRAPHLPASQLMREVREAVRSVAPVIPAFRLETVEQRLAIISATERVVAGLAGAVSLLGLLLAAVGLYGMLAYAITERRREIGVRAALGAAPGELRRVVLTDGVGRVLAGLIPGLLGAAAASRWLESLLFSVTPFDPTTYVASVVVLIVVALAASWLPARWAASVSPAEVLRVDA